MSERTRPSDRTREEEARAAGERHVAGREPTADEEATAERDEVDSSSREAYEEMLQRGARQQGEGKPGI
jgi:hypothetical protein